MQEKSPKSPLKGFSRSLVIAPCAQRAASAENTRHTWSSLPVHRGQPVQRTRGTPGHRSLCTEGSQCREHAAHLVIAPCAQRAASAENTRHTWSSLPVHRGQPVQRTRGTPGHRSLCTEGSQCREHAAHLVIAPCAQRAASAENTRHTWSSLPVHRGQPVQRTRGTPGHRSLCTEGSQCREHAAHLVIAPCAQRAASAENTRHTWSSLPVHRGQPVQRTRGTPGHRSLCTEGSQCREHAAHLVIAPCAQRAASAENTRHTWSSLPVHRGQPVQRTRGTPGHRSLCTEGSQCREHAAHLVIAPCAQRAASAENTRHTWSSLPVHRGQPVQRTRGTPGHRSLCTEGSQCREHAAHLVIAPCAQRAASAENTRHTWSSLPVHRGQPVQRTRGTPGHRSLCTEGSQCREHAAHLVIAPCAQRAASAENTRHTWSSLPVHRGQPVQRTRGTPGHRSLCTEGSQCREHAAHLVIAPCAQRAASAENTRHTWSSLPVHRGQPVQRTRGTPGHRSLCTEGSQCREHAAHLVIAPCAQRAASAENTRHTWSSLPVHRGQPVQRTRGTPGHRSLCTEGSQCREHAAHLVIAPCAQRAASAENTRHTWSSLPVHRGQPVQRTRGTPGHRSLCTEGSQCREHAAHLVIAPCAQRAASAENTRHTWSSLPVHRGQPVQRTRGTPGHRSLCTEGSQCREHAAHLVIAPCAQRAASAENTRHTWSSLPVHRGQPVQRTRGTPGHRSLCTEGSQCREHAAHLVIAPCAQRAASAENTRHTWSSLPVHRGQPVQRTRGTPGHRSLCTEGSQCREHAAHLVIAPCAQRAASAENTRHTWSSLPVHRGQPVQRTRGTPGHRSLCTEGSQCREHAAHLVIAPCAQRAASAENTRHTWSSLPVHRGQPVQRTRGTPGHRSLCTEGSQCREHAAHLVIAPCAQRAASAENTRHTWSSLPVHRGQPVQRTRGTPGHRSLCTEGSQCREHAAHLVIAPCAQRAASAENTRHTWSSLPVHRGQPVQRTRGTPGHRSLCTEGSQCREHAAHLVIAPCAQRAASAENTRHTWSSLPVHRGQPVQRTRGTPGHRSLCTEGSQCREHAAHLVIAPCAQRAASAENTRHTWSSLPVHRGQPVQRTRGTPGHRSLCTEGSQCREHAAHLVIAPCAQRAASAENTRHTWSSLPVHRGQPVQRTRGTPGHRSLCTEGSQCREHAAHLVIAPCAQRAASAENTRHTWSSLPVHRGQPVQRTRGTPGHRSLCTEGSQCREHAAHLVIAPCAQRAASAENTRHTWSSLPVHRGQPVQRTRGTPGHRSLCTEGSQCREHAAHLVIAPCAQRAASAENTRHTWSSLPVHRGQPVQRTRGTPGHRSLCTEGSQCREHAAHLVIAPCAQRAASAENTRHTWSSLPVHRGQPVQRTRGTPGHRSLCTEGSQCREHAAHLVIAPCAQRAASAENTRHTWSSLPVHRGQPVQRTRGTPGHRSLCTEGSQCREHAAHLVIAPCAQRAASAENTRHTWSSLPVHRGQPVLFLFFYIQVQM
ncbi:UNVERIFIED_CONTAM: hypothetical protein FKN15_039006 [Acipenser sinensis]